MSNAQPPEAKSQKCSSCGAMIASGTPENLCPACLLGNVIGGQTNAEDQSETLRIGESAGILGAPMSGDRIGRYKLLQKIGEGGCGIVYMAEQEEPVRRRVALKVIKLGMDTKQVIARFEAERQALAMMDHPNIAKVFDAGATEAGRPYFVMELVRGIRITDYCDQNKLSTTARLELFTQVCNAIQHAHQKGIIHRDIKPSNILVTLHDGVPVPKVIDFGIAKATDQKLTDKTLFTAFQQFIGTPAYMSPEQAEMSGMDIDTRSDIYSLGVLLYELLTGRTPFDALDLLRVGFDEMRRRIREEEPPKPSTRLSTLQDLELADAARLRQSAPPKLISLLRGDLDWIVMKALEKDRTRRYETATGLGRDVSRYLRAEPIEAAPHSVLRRVRLFAKRNGRRLRLNTLWLALAGVITLMQWLGVSMFYRTFLLPGTSFNPLYPYWTRRSVAVHGIAILLGVGALLGTAKTVRKNPTMFACGLALVLSTLSVLVYRAVANPIHTVMREATITGYACYQRDGTLVVPMRNGMIQSWRGNSHEPITAIDLAPLRPTKVAAAPDGNHLAVVCDEGVFLIESGRGNALAVTNTRHASCVAFSPDSQRLAVFASSSYENGGWKKPPGGNLRIFSATDGKLLSTESVPNLSGGWQCLDWKKNVIAVCEAYDEDKGRSTLLWNVEEHRPIRFIMPADYTALSVELSSDAATVAIGYAPYDMGLWDVKSGRLLHTLVSQNNWVVCLAFSPDGRTLASGEGNSAVRLWDVASGQQQRCFPMGNPHGSDYTDSVSFDPTGKFLACGSAREAIVIWKLK